MHILAWSFALLVTALFIWLTGTIGAILAGALVGLFIGIAQAWMLFNADEMQQRRRWLLVSSLGGFLGLFPAVAIGLITFFNLWLGIFLIGLMFGAVFGLLQAVYLVQLLDDFAYLWIPVCMLACGLGALLTVPMLTTGLPIFLSPGSIVFALLTGSILSRWFPEEAE